ncbi:MAG TPA: hypothetical protein VF516_29060 [Kofleriaceae bacterium]
MASRERASTEPRRSIPDRHKRSDLIEWRREDLGLAWSIDLPDGAEATARWLDAMTNAVDDRTPGGLGWR